MPEMRAVPGGRVRPWPLTWRLGVYAVNTPTGVRVTRVLPGTPAWSIGLEHGDVIITVNGYQVGYVRGRLYPLGEELQRRAGSRGDVLLMVQDVRTDRLLNLDVTLERFPRPVEPQPLPGFPRDDKAQRDDKAER
jgi:S1-C subfamily serine protease